MSSCEKQSLVTPGNLAGIGTSAIATTAPAVPSPGQQQGQVIKSFPMSRLRTISLCHQVGNFSRAFRNQTATLLSFTTRSSRVIVRLLLHITYAYKQCKILSYNPTGCFLMLLHFLTRFRSLDKNTGLLCWGLQVPKLGKLQKPSGVFVLKGGWFSTYTLIASQITVNACNLFLFLKANCKRETRKELFLGAGPGMINWKDAGDIWSDNTVHPSCMHCLDNWGKQQSDMH